MRRILFIAMMMVAGCAQIPPSPQEIQAKKFESVRDKTVIYLVRGDPDTSSLAAPIALDGTGGVTTYPGTFVRWEVAPGTHRIAGAFGDVGTITLQGAAGAILYVRQSVTGVQMPTSFLEILSAQDGQSYVMLATLIPVN